MSLKQEEIDKIYNNLIRIKNIRHELKRKEIETEAKKLKLEKEEIKLKLEKNKLLEELHKNGFGGNGPGERKQGKKEIDQSFSLF